jgi:hypothetical protein
MSFLIFRKNIVLKMDSTFEEPVSIVDCRTFIVGALRKIYQNLHLQYFSDW